MKSSIQKKKNLTSKLHEESILSVQKVGEVVSKPVEFKTNGDLNSFEEYKKIYHKAKKNPNKFWGEIANKLYWKKQLGLMF